MFNYNGSSVIENVIGSIENLYRFTYVDVGAQGRASDGGVFGASSLHTVLENGSLHIPPPRSPPGSNTPMNYVIMADEAFPLKPYLMRPYPRRLLTDERKVSNCEMLPVVLTKIVISEVGGEVSITCCPHK